MTRRELVLGLAVLPGLYAATALAADAKKKEQGRADIRKTVQQTLGRLYKVQPSAKAAVERAAGYAVFNNFGMKILVAGTGTGKGLAVDNKTKQQTFMKMVELQAGLGFGVKKFSLIWVFDTAAGLDGFVNSGWELGAQASAAAKAGDKGAAMQGAMAIAPGVWLYQLTDTGLALELTAKGTKYYKDSDLNS
ncbi:MAG TPA: YSC84-related protein [Candidatus Baltobacteraceae bacterium]|nr:YSC84-related protein [Candidatus Baltobacteraceae bacterium]